MKKLLDNWTIGIENLFFGYAVSLYAYFSVVLSGIIYIWISHKESALIFTILSVANILTICLCGILKYRWGFTKKELIVARIYLICLIVIFIIGCFVDFSISFNLILMPIVFSGIMVLIRDLQAMQFVRSENRVLKFLTKLFSYNVVWLLTYVLVIGLPFVIFFYSIYVALVSKVFAMIIAFAFLLFLPFIIWFEVFWIRGTIFDIAFNVAWNKDTEGVIVELHKLFETLNDEEFLKIAEQFESTFLDDPNLSTKIFLEELQKLRENNKKSDK